MTIKYFVFDINPETVSHVVAIFGRGRLAEALKLVEAGEHLQMQIADWDEGVLPPHSLQPTKAVVHPRIHTLMPLGAAASGGYRRKKKG